MGEVKAAAVMLAVALASSAHAAARRSPPQAGSASLEGLWSMATYTQFERPDSLKHLVLTPEEGRAYEAELAKTQGIDFGGEKDEIGQVDSEFNDAGTRLSRVRGQIRSSWLVSPADGKVSYTDAGKRLMHLPPYRTGSRRDGPEGLNPSTRCLEANGSAPPFRPSQDTNLLQVVQTPADVAFLAEKNHDVRTVRMGARPPNEPPSWSGNAYGHWEGRTLVVETQGFREPIVDRFWIAFSGDAKVIERFTRKGDELAYSFTVIDPGVLLEPLQGEMVFEKAKGRLFEYACHEGNYALPGILRARLLSKPAKAP